MARLITPFEGLSGRLGNIVFRTWGGKTFMYCRPSSPRKQSAAQKEHRLKFRSASHKAKCLLADPDQRSHYQQEAQRLQLPNAYTAIMRELMQKKG